MTAALCIYLGGVIAIGSLMAFEFNEFGKTAWGWYALVAWPALLPVAACLWVQRRRAARGLR